MYIGHTLPTRASRYDIVCDERNDPDERAVEILTTDREDVKNLPSAWTIHRAGKIIDEVASFHHFKCTDT
jgi:hypothetical protein